MVDREGKELFVGDEILYSRYNDADLHQGKIFKVTKSRVIVQLSAPTVNTWNNKTYVYKNEHHISSSSQIYKLG